MIRIKTNEELKILREGGKILAGILNHLGKMLEPGLSTEDLETVALGLIEQNNAWPAFKDYEMPDGEIFPTALCVSINDEVVHGPATPERILKNGDIVGIDLGMEYPVKNGNLEIPKNKFSKHGGYFTDTAATFAVGEIADDARRLVSTTRKCLMEGIKIVKPGITLNDIGKTIQARAEKAGYAVVRELVGHGVGHEAHEEPQVPHYEIKDNSLVNEVLKEGMVIAIEPMINIGGWKVKTKEDGFTVVTADGSLSAHFEHTVAVTKNGHKVLTAL